jgi:hypothetical protein
MRFIHVWSRVRKWWGRRDGTERLEMSFQGIIALATIAYVTVAYKQLGQMRAQNENNQQSLTTLQRAFIFDRGADLVQWTEPFLPNIPASASTNGVIMHFENSGSTAATDIIETSNLCVLQGDISNDFSYTDLPDAGEHRRAFVGPKSTFDSPLGVRPELLDEVGTFKKQLFIWGRVRYLDIFRQPHVTQFCEKYLGFVKMKNTSTITDYFEQCPAHNCADNDCPKRWGYVDTIECENVPPQPPTRVPEPSPK